MKQWFSSIPKVLCHKSEFFEKTIATETSDGLHSKYGEGDNCVTWRVNYNLYLVHNKDTNTFYLVDYSESGKQKFFSFSKEGFTTVVSARTSFLLGNSNYTKREMYSFPDIELQWIVINNAIRGRYLNPVSLSEYENVHREKFGRDPEPTKIEFSAPVIGYTMAEQLLRQFFNEPDPSITGIAVIDVPVETV